MTGAIVTGAGRGPESQGGAVLGGDFGPRAVLYAEHQHTWGRNGHELRSLAGWVGITHLVVGTGGDG